MATRTKRNRVEPATCGICGVPAGSLHVGLCPFAKKPDEASNGDTPASLPARDAPLFDIRDLSATENEIPAPVRIQLAGDAHATSYQWARFGGFSLRTRLEIASLADQIWRVRALGFEELGEEDEAAYYAAIERVIDIALPAITPEHRGALDLRQREDLTTAFFLDFTASRSQEVADRRTARRPTGERSSPPSDGSSPETHGMTG